MGESLNLDLENIAQRCNLYSKDNPELTIKKILALDETYEVENLGVIYNYFLEKCKTPIVLCEIIKCTDRIRNKTSLPYLVDILVKNPTPKNNEDYVNVRVLCAKAIANLKDTSAVHALLYCLNNKNENYKVRFACADALGKIGDRFAVTPLINVMQDEEEHSVYLRESAASALGMLGDMRAIDPLVSILETKKGIIDKFTYLKEHVIEALGKLRIGNDKRVFRALKSSLLDASPQIRINAIEAIMDSEHPEAFDTIKTCLFDENDEVKKNALIALYNLSDKSILEEVIQSGEYCDFLKQEATTLIEEYENDENEY